MVALLLLLLFKFRFHDCIFTFGFICIVWFRLFVLNRRRKFQFSLSLVADSVMFIRHRVIHLSMSMHILSLLLLLLLLSTLSCGSDFQFRFACNGCWGYDTAVHCLDDLNFTQFRVHIYSWFRFDVNMLNRFKQSSDKGMTAFCLSVCLFLFHFFFSEWVRSWFIQIHWNRMERFKFFISSRSVDLDGYAPEISINHPLWSHFRFSTQPLTAIFRRLSPGYQQCRLMPLETSYKGNWRHFDVTIISLQFGCIHRRPAPATPLHIPIKRLDYYPTYYLFIGSHGGISVNLNGQRQSGDLSGSVPTATGHSSETRVWRQLRFVPDCLI